MLKSGNYHDLVRHISDCVCLNFSFEIDEVLAILGIHFLLKIRNAVSFSKLMLEQVFIINIVEIFKLAFVNNILFLLIKSEFV